MTKKIIALFICCLLMQTTVTNLAAQVLVKDITSGLNSTFAYFRLNRGTYKSNNHIVYNGKLYFTATTPGATPAILTEPYVTDGTTKGTQLLKNIHPTGNSDAECFFEFNNEIYFRANDGTNGSELWKSNGTEAGTVMVRDIRTGAAGSFPHNFVSFKNHLYFLAQGSVFAELWRTDGTSNGTTKVTDLNTSMSYSAKEIAVYMDTLFFIGASDRRLYRTGDGLTVTPCTTAGGKVVSGIGELVIWDTSLIFNGEIVGGSPIVGYELYNYDTLNGIELKCNINNSSISSNPNVLTPVNDKLYFSASINSLGIELYVIDDDSSSKATLVKDINPGALHSAPASLFPFGNKLLFTADVNNGSNPEREVYCTDGTASGTVKLTSGSQTNGSANPSLFGEFTTVGAEVCFAATPVGNHTRIYLTDGTVNGTRVATRPHKDSISFTSTHERMFYNNKLYFFGDNGRIGTELYVLDKSWMEEQDSVLYDHCKVWVKADTNLMYSNTNDATITTLLNDVRNYEMFTGTSNNFPRTDPSIVHNGRNGKPVIQFNADAKDGYLQTLANRNFVTTKSATIITVAAKANNANNRNTLVGMRPVPGFAHNLILAESNNFGSNKLSLGVHDGNSFCNSVGNTTWAADDKYSIITASVDRNIVYTKINGVIQDSVSNSCTIADDIKGIWIGGSGFDYEPFEGKIGEVFIFDTVLTRTQRNMLEMYLSLKFKAGADTVDNPAIGNSKGIYVFNNSGAAVYFVKNNDADNSGSLTTTVVAGNPGASAGFTGSATSHDGTVVTPKSIGTNSYWRIVNNGITDFEYDIMIDLNNVNIDSLEQRVILKRDNTTAQWQPLNTKRFGRYLYAQGLTSFSEFAVSSNMPDTVTPPQFITDTRATCNSLVAYPNPAGGTVNIKFNNAQSGDYIFTLQNVQGKVVMSVIKNMMGMSMATVDISSLAPGIYMLQATDIVSGDRYYTKVIKK